MNEQQEKKISASFKTLIAPPPQPQLNQIRTIMVATHDNTIKCNP